MTKEELKAVTPLHAIHESPQAVISQLQAEIAELRTENAQLQAENKKLQMENAQLEAHIRKMASDSDPGGPYVVTPSSSFTDET